MFKKKDQTTRFAASSEKFDTLIGPHAELVGDLHIRASTRIDGSVKGNVIADESTDCVVAIGVTAIIDGNVQGARVVVAGQVRGNIEAYSSIELYAQAQVTGDVKYGILLVEQGAQVEGRMQKLVSASAGEH